MLTVFDTIRQGATRTYTRHDARSHPNLMNEANELQPKLKRKRQILRDARIALSVASAAVDPDRPLITHLVITRRCNLSCGYCFEYDKVSQPVPLPVL